MKKIILIFFFLSTFQVFPSQNRLKINFDQESLDKNRKILEDSAVECVLKTLKSDYNRLYRSYLNSIKNGNTPVFTDISWSTPNRSKFILEYTISNVSRIKKTYIFNTIAIDYSDVSTIHAEISMILKTNIFSFKLNKEFKTISIKEFNLKYLNGKFIQAVEKLLK